MAVRLFPRDPTLVDQGLNEGVVLGDLDQLAIAEQIATRITDVHQSKTVAREQDCGQCGAHPLELGLHLDLRRDRRVAGAHRRVELGEQVATGFVVVEVGERGDHQLRGHLAGGVAAHAVGQCQKSSARVNRVFVVGAYQSAIAAGGISQDQGHGRNSSTPAGINAKPASSSCARVTGATPRPRLASMPSRPLRRVRGSRAQLNRRLADPDRRSDGNSCRSRHLRPVKVSAVGRS
ncbi:hypothetical protein MYSI104531_22590 [Mycobacterium simiae]